MSKFAYASSVRACAALYAGVAAATYLAASPQWMFSADDQSSFYKDGGMGVRPGARAGAVSALDFSTFPPKSYHIDGVPCSVIGPPAAVAAKGGNVVVVGSMKVDPQNPAKLMAGADVSLLSIDPQTGFTWKDTVSAGKEPTGVTLSPDGKTAYVALRGEGAVARYDIEGGKLILLGKQTVAKPEDLLCLVTLSPDGKTALASLHAAPAIMVFEVAADGSLKEKQTLPTPNNPYDIHFIHGGKRALISCTLVDTVVTLERASDGQWAVKGTAKTGRIAEGLEVSPDEKWISVSCFDGANAGPRDKKWHGQPGRVYLFAVGDDGLLAQTQALDVEGVQQAATFSPDGKYLAVGQFGAGNLAIFALKDGQWRDTGVRIELPGQCASLFAEL